MKRIGLLIVLFMGFSVINGYGNGLPDISGSGGSQKAYIPRPTERNATGQRMGVNLEAITNEIEGMGKRVEKLENSVTQLENERKKDPSPSDKKETVPADGQSIPINWAIISEQKEKLDGLNYYVSKDISVTIPGLVKTSTKIQDGILEEIKDERPAEKLVISKNDPGKMQKFSPAPTGRESMEIFFSAKSAVLTFTRNKNNCFELASVRKDGREFGFEDEATPTLLYIKYKGGPLGTTGRTERGRQDSGQYREPAAPERRGPPAIIKNILLERGQGYLTQDAVVDYMRDHNGSSWFSRRDISDLVNAYFEIAKEERVNHEIAIAQMWYVTRKLSQDALLRNYNYGGLNAVERGTFNGRDMGVRAHIQHLKGYASTVRPKNIVDPRYEILVTNGYLGKGTTLGKLSVWWSANKDYEAEITKILDALYRYQYQYDSRR